MGSLNISALSIPAQIIPTQPPARTLPAAIQAGADPTGFLNLIESLIGGEITPPQPTQLATGPAKPTIPSRRGKVGNGPDPGTDKNDRKNPRDSQQQDAPTMTTIPANSTQVRPRIYPISLSIALPKSGKPTDQYVATQTEKTNPISAGVQQTTVQAAATQVPATAVPVPLPVPPTAPESKDQTTTISNPPKCSSRSQSHDAREVQPAADTASPAPVGVAAPIAVPVAAVPVVVPAVVSIPQTVVPVTPQVPVKDAAPVSKVSQKAGDAPKSLTTPSRISSTEETRQPEPVSFQARLTEHDPEPGADQRQNHRAIN